MKYHTYHRTRFPQRRHSKFTTVDLVEYCVTGLLIAVAGLAMAMARPDHAGTPWMVVSFSLVLAAAVSVAVAFYRWSKS